MKLAALNEHGLPQPELAYKPGMKFNLEMVQNIGKNATMPSDDPIIQTKPKKTLRKFAKGSMNRDLLTMNVVIEFP